MSEKMGTALVLGSGIAGLLTARVLSDHFEHVLILERDPPVTSSAPRAGAPQGNHVHGLRARGQRIIEALCPGFEADLRRAGAHKADDEGMDVKLFLLGHWGVDTHVDFGLVCATRGLIESVLRNRIASIPNVSIRYDTTADDLVYDATSNRVTGVMARTGGSDQDKITADFVVDAAGRGAFSMRALKSIGFDAPPEETVGLDFGYATAFYEVPQNVARNWQMLILASAPPNSSGGLLMPVEGNRWLVSLAGRGDSRPPTDPEAFTAYASRLDHPALYEAIMLARRTSEIKSYRFPAAIRRRFDLLTRHPEGFLAIGDALNSLNPLFGQGMSVSAIECEELGRQLQTRAKDARGLEGLWRNFYPATKAIVDVPWNQTLQIDLQYNETRYPRPAGFAIQKRIMTWAQTVIHADPELRASFTRLLNFVDGPEDAITLPRLLAGQFRRWMNRAPKPEEPMSRPEIGTSAAA